MITILAYFESYRIVKISNLFVVTLKFTIVIYFMASIMYFIILNLNFII